MTNNETLDTENFTLTIDEEDTKAFANILNDESLMRAGFVMHQANNINPKA